MDKKKEYNEIFIDEKNNINVEFIEKLQNLQLKNKLLIEYIKEKELDLKYTYEAYRKIMKIAHDFYAILHLYDKVDNAVSIEYDLFNFLDEKITNSLNNINFNDFQNTYKKIKITYKPY